MIVTCEACGTSYTLKAGLLNASGSTVRCSNCQHVFMVYPETADAENLADVPASSPPLSPGEEVTLSDKEDEGVVETEKELDAIFAEEKEDAFDEETEELAATVESLDLLEEDEDDDDWVSEVGPELEEFDREIRRTSQDTDVFFEDEASFEDMPDETGEKFKHTPDDTPTMEDLEETEVIGLDDLSTQTIDADEEILNLDMLEGGSEADYQLLTETAEGESAAGYELLTETAEGESAADYELLTETAEGESVADYELLTETAEGESVAGYELLTETAEGESAAGYELLTATAEGESVTSFDAGPVALDGDDDIIGLETLETPLEWEGETRADIDGSVLKTAIGDEDVIGLDLMESESRAGYDFLTEAAEGESVTSFDAGPVALDGDDDIIGLETLETPLESEGDTRAVEWEGETRADIGASLLKTAIEDEDVIGLDILEGESMAGYDFLTEAAEGESVVSFDVGPAAFDEDDEIIGLETLETPPEWEGDTRAVEWEGETRADIDGSLLKTAIEDEDVIGLDMLEDESEAGYQLLTETAEGESAAGYELLTETAEGGSVAGFEDDGEDKIVGLDDIGEQTVEDGLLDIDEEDFNLDDILAEEDALAEQETASAKDVFEADEGVQPDDIEWVEQKEREIEAKGGLLTELEDDGKTPDSKKTRIPKDTELGEEEFNLDLEFGEAGEAAETQNVDDSDLGLDLDLDEFDLDLVDEQETPVTGDKSIEKETASGPGQGSDEFDLDFEEEEPGAVEKQGIEEAGEFEEELDLDFESEATEESEEFDLDLDLEATAETAETPAHEQEAEEEFDLGFDEGVSVDGDEEIAAETLIAGDEFDLDLDAETAEDAGEAEAEEFDLDLDLEATAETAETPTQAAEEEFDLGFDEGVSVDGDEEIAAETLIAGDEFDLDLDAETAEDAGDAEAEEFDLDLDLGETAESATQETGAEEDLDLDLDFDAVGVTLDGSDDDSEEPLSTGEDEFDLDLDAEPAAEATGESEAFDLDLDFGETADAEDASVKEAEEAEITVVGATEEEAFDLDLDLGETAETLETPAHEAEDEFDIDLDLGETADADVSEEGDEFDLDLDFDPGGATAESTEEDLSFDLDLEESLVTTEATAEADEDFELDLDLGDNDQTEAPEADLSEADEFLDLDLEEAPAGPDESEGAEDAFDLGLEMAEPTEAKDAVGDDFDLDLETMLDEEEEVVEETDKEISLETIGDSGEREAYKGSEDFDEESALEMEAWTKDAIATKEATPDVADTVAATAGIEPEEEAVPEPKEAVDRLEPATDTAKRKIPAKKAIVIVCAAAALLALLIVGAYLMFGKKSVEPSVPDKGNLQIEISEIPSYAFVQNEKAGELLVVSGTVTNRYDHPRKQIKVKASLFDASGKLITISTAISGISLDDKEAQSLDIKAIEDKLNNRKGDPKFNMPLKPGRKIPFTVVFSNLPDNMDELSCEVVASSESALK